MENLQIVKQIQVLRRRIFSMRNLDISRSKIEDVEKEVERLEKSIS